MDEKNVFTRLMFNAEYDHFESLFKSYGLTGVKLSTGRWCRAICIDATHDYVEISHPPTWDMNFTREEEQAFLDEIERWNAEACKLEESGKSFSFDTFQNNSFWNKDGITIVKKFQNIWISEDFNTDTLLALGFSEREFKVFSLRNALIDVSPRMRCLSLRERTFYIPSENV